MSRAGIWFRGDLRLLDNPAVTAALQTANTATPAVFFLCTGQLAAHDWAPIKFDFLYRRLEQFQHEAAAAGIVFEVVAVDSWNEISHKLLEFAEQHQLRHIHYNFEYPLDERQRDLRTTEALARADIQLHGYHGSLIVPPELKTGQGKMYQKFTPFNKQWRAYIYEKGLGSPQGLSKPQQVAQLPAIPHVDYPRRDSSAYTVSEEGALHQLETFLSDRVSSYSTERDRPDLDTTSRLSPYWEVGILSPLTAARKLARQTPDFPHGLAAGADTWLSELAWREFYLHLIHHVPRLSQGKAFLQHTEAMSWRNDKAEFKRWCEGSTGFPIVDAGMRQLQAEGWMHNRVRMIVANFLVKDLLIDWRWGERFFMQHLIDGSFAANNGGWQWSASTGNDAVPYFRVFNPTRQSEKVDPDGSYIRRWVKELADCPAKLVHEPSAWVAENGVKYPAPMVDHRAARERFLERFKQL